MIKISLHRALGELKLTEAKINKKIANLKVVGYKKNDGLVNSTTELEAFNTGAKAQYDSIRALIKRKNEIKTKIVFANATTKVTVAGEEMTIADAITKKDNIHLDEAFLARLQADLRKSQATVEQHNTKIDNNALELIRASLGSEAETTSEQADAIRNSYVKTNKIELVNPLKAEEIISELEESISNFKTEVDAVLSEANAITQIELEE